MQTCEVDAWGTILPEDLWILDKLILSRYLGHICGPVGIDVPSPGSYIVRPAINPIGMGVGASIRHIEKSTDHLPVGYFWSEIFTGRHLSFDYHCGEQILAVEGFKSNGSLCIWDKWVKTDDKFPLPIFLYTLAVRYQYFNIEVIGNKIIECHFRCNPDFWINENPANEVIPLWEDEEFYEKDGYTFISDVDFSTVKLRKGIYVK